jgi:hypothetical protein
MGPPLKIAVVSDIHLGHRTTPTSSIIENLEAAFPDNSETAMLDIIFLAGDVFDDRLNLPQEDVWEIELWIANFLKRCKKHRIMVRVLKGTSSHDWDQSKAFMIINQLADIGADLKYIDDLSIEYIEQYGISVLYVPDDLEGGPDKTLSRVHNLLKANELEQVDYAIMHGQFEYQLPEHVHAPKHNSEAYMKIVKRLIFIGHVHTYSSFMDMIFAQGSFDRLAHGQEEAKGHLRATVYDDGHFEMVFKETVNAKKYVTIDLNGLDTDESIQKIDSIVSGLPDDSFVRVFAKAGHPVLKNTIELVRRHPTHHWSSKEDKDKKEEEEDKFTDDTQFVTVNITPENVGPMLLDRIASRGASSAILDVCAKILDEEIANAV